MGRDIVATEVLRLLTPRVIRLSADDNVVVAVDQIPPGSEVAGQTARERIPRGHKMAVVAIETNEPVRKYGQIIGFASKAIAPGDWVHEHNVALHDFTRDYRFAEAAKNDGTAAAGTARTFQGICGPTARPGTRNYIGVLTSVNCSASVAKFIAEEVRRSGILDDYPGIDGVVPFVHGTGCAWRRAGGLGRAGTHAMGLRDPSQLGRGVMVGLGCEVFQIDRMKDEYSMSRATIFRP